MAWIRIGVGAGVAQYGTGHHVEAGENFKAPIIRGKRRRCHWRRQSHGRRRRRGRWLCRWQRHRRWRWLRRRQLRQRCGRQSRQRLCRLRRHGGPSRRRSSWWWSWPYQAYHTYVHSRARAAISSHNLSTVSSLRPKTLKTHERKVEKKP